MRNIAGAFKSLLFFYHVRYNNGIFIIGLIRTRFQIVPDSTCTKIKWMLLIEIVNKIGFSVQLCNTKSKWKSCFFICLAVHFVLILIKPDYKSGAKPVVEVMCPFNSKVTVRICIGGIAFQRKSVVAEISGKIKVVSAINTVTDSQVNILERGPAVFILIRQQTQQPIGISAAAAEDEWCFVFLKRPF